MNIADSNRKNVRQFYFKKAKRNAQFLHIYPMKFRKYFNLGQMRLKANTITN